MRIQAALFNALNVVMRPLLRSPLGRLAPANLCLLSYRGRKSGRSYTTPLSYMRDGSLVRLLSSHETRWWHNFLAEPLDVELEIDGESFRGRARALVDEGARLRDGVRAFLTAVPRDAVVYGIKLDDERRPREEDIAKVGGRVVLVEVEIEAQGAR